MNRIEIRVTDDLTLDAWAVEEAADHFTIHPQETPMIDQLLTYLENKPYRYSDIQTRHICQ